MPLKILFVDDEPDLEPLILQKFRKRIRDGELELSFAQNGEEALGKLLEDDEIEIVFSDINMPVMDGLTLLTRIGALNRTLKTIIVSAYDDMQNIRAAMNRGAFDFLTKPIDFQDFEQTLSKTKTELQSIRDSHIQKEQLIELQGELSVASRIQQSILPCIFPVTPEYEIFAAMLPARLVGGDFYDFFTLDPHRVAFAVGDVSGKGVPAAIFMAVCRTLLRATAHRSASTRECLETVHGILLLQNTGEMYVTLLYGILNIETGDVEFSVAGQTPPYVLAPGQAPRCVRETTGNMLGLFPEVEVGSDKLQLKSGETLLLFTDGVPDAEDCKGSCFGHAHLQATLASCNGSAAETVERVMSEVKKFAVGAVQSDDVTVLALRYRKE
jgi:sigma-B regulation protein RsbU (phosphoserine phosphatase)